MVNLMNPTMSPSINNNLVQKFSSMSIQQERAEKKTEETPLFAEEKNNDNNHYLDDFCKRLEEFLKKELDNISNFEDEDALEFGQLALGPVKVSSFDLEKGLLTFEFKNSYQKDKFYHQSAELFKSQPALASKFLKSGVSSSILHTETLQVALTEMASFIKEKSPTSKKVYDKNLQAHNLAKKTEKQKKTIQDLKNEWVKLWGQVNEISYEEIAEKIIELFFESYHLNPKSAFYVPYFVQLMPVIIIFAPHDFSEILNIILLNVPLNFYLWCNIFSRVEHFSFLGKIYYSVFKACFPNDFFIYRNHNFSYENKMLVEKTMEENEKKYKVHMETGIEYFNNKTYEQAKKSFCEAKNYFFLSPHVYLMLSLCHYAENDFEKTIELLVKANKCPNILDIDISSKILSNFFKQMKSVNENVPETDPNYYSQDVIVLKYILQFLIAIKRNPEKISHDKFKNCCDLLFESFRKRRISPFFAQWALEQLSVVTIDLFVNDRIDFKQASAFYNSFFSLLRSALKDYDFSKTFLSQEFKSTEYFRVNIYLSHDELQNQDPEVTMDCMQTKNVQHTVFNMLANLYDSFGSFLVAGCDAKTSEILFEGLSRLTDNTQEDNASINEHMARILFVKLIESKNDSDFAKFFTPIVKQVSSLSTEFIEWACHKTLQLCLSQFFPHETSKILLSSIGNSIVEFDHKIKDQSKLIEKVFFSNISSQSLKKVNFSSKSPERYSKPKEDNLHKTYRAQERLEKRKNNRSLVIEVPSFEVSEGVFLSFCFETFGIQKDESLSNYVLRLQKLCPPDFRDMSIPFKPENLGSVDEEKKENESIVNWSVPLKTPLLSQTREFHKAYKEYIEKILLKNENLENGCLYSGDVNRNLDITRMFKQNQNSHVALIANEDVPNINTLPFQLQLEEFALFLKDLQTKRDKHKQILEIKNIFNEIQTKKIEKSHKIVFMVATVIQTIKENKKLKDGFFHDLYFEYKEDADYAYLLFFEVFMEDLKLKIVKDHMLLDKIESYSCQPVHNYSELYKISFLSSDMESFRGPEKHIFGEGANWPHLHAAVLNDKGSAVEIHIYYGNGKDF